jgi:hypothetical protein
MVTDAPSRKRSRETLNLLLCWYAFENIARCLILADRLRCILTNVESEIKVFHDLHTHFSRISDLTGRNDKTSVISSSGRNTCNIFECRYELV